MTGIFTTDFFDDQRGIIMGGNWEVKESELASKAVTTDGGISWNLIAQNELPGFISCVQYVPEGDARKILAVSTEGMFYSEDTGITWNRIEAKGYYSLRFVDNQTAWVARYEEIAKIKPRLCVFGDLLHSTEWDTILPNLLLPRHWAE